MARDQAAFRVMRARHVEGQCAARNPRKRNSRILISNQNMNARTTQRLKKLESFPWFVNAGQFVSRDYLTVASWAEAVESSAAEIWSSVQLQVSNRLAREVRQNSYERSEEWNGIAAELRKGIAVIVANSIDPVAKKFKLKPDFQGAVSWDMLMICMETEFSDLVSPLFFIPRLCPIYETGHFPCGWEGPKLNEGWQEEHPNWRLIVY